ncbi:MAG: DUF4838 domain-containing protein [Kiritimatiellae bacterium]|nr:DUF4838 domain-containing protein [Kiritimatiellia bacterium]
MSTPAPTRTPAPALTRTPTPPRTPLRHSAFCFLHSAFLLAATASAADFQLATNGKARAAIVVPAAADKALNFASKELADYLGKMTTGRFMVADKPLAGVGTIRLGYDAALGNPEAFSVRVADGELKIAGGGPRGAIYGVYDLLEHFGCGFWAPDNETVPLCTNLVLAADYAKTDAPKIATRAADTPFGDAAYHLKLRANWSRINDASERTIASFGGSAMVDIMHSLASRKCVDRRVYFDKHPEWFALAKVKDPASWPYIRKSGLYEATNGVPEELRGEWVRFRLAICPTNPEMRQELLRRIDAYLATHYPAEKSFSLSPEDNHEVCECPRCRALMESDTSRSPSVLYIDLCNFVADHFRDKYPDVRFNLLSYGSCLDAPDDAARFHLRPNCGVAVAHHWRNHGLPVNCAERFHGRFLKWKKVCDTFYYWDYYTCFTAYANPFPNRLLLSDAYRFYADNGFQGGFAQMTRNRLTPFADMLWWIKGRLAWNPYADVEALTDQYFKGAYGAAAPAARRILDILEHARNRERSLWMGDYVSDTSPLLSVADIVEIRRLCDRLQGAVRNDPNRGRRLAAWRLAFLGDYLAAMRYPELADADKTGRMRKEGWKPYVSRIEAVLKDWRNSAEATGSKFLLNEHGTDSFWHVLKDAYRDDPRSLPEPADKPPSVVIPAGRMNPKAKSTALERDADGTAISALHFNWGPNEPQYMSPSYSETGFDVTNGMAGTWYVFADVRAGATVSNDEATAYCGIYAPWYIGDAPVKPGKMEIASRRIERTPDDTGWRLESLGRWRLPPGTRVWVMPGVLHPTTNVAVRAFHLVRPDAFTRDSLKPDTAATPWVVRDEDKIDRYPFWSALPPEGEGTVPAGRFVEAPVRKAYGPRHVFARVRVRDRQWFDNRAARLEHVRGGEVLASRAVTAQKGDNTWQIVSLGAVDLAKGDSLRLVPDSGEATELTVRDFLLAAPELFSHD